MCFSCQEIDLVIDGGCTVTYCRGYDAYTQPSDFDLDEGSIAAFRKGDWGYVSLTAKVFGADGEHLGSCCLYGIPEWLESPCALEDAEAVQWVTQQAFKRATEAVFA